MRKTILLLVLACISLGSVLAQPCQVKQSNYQNVRLTFSTAQPVVKNIQFQQQEFSLLSVDGFTIQSAAGKPALPALVKTIEIPLGDGLSYSVASIQLDTVDGALLGIEAPVMPAQPSRSKSDNTPVVLVKDDAVYSSNAFYGADMIELAPLGIARDRNLAKVTFNPMRWNPITNQVIIVKEITIDIVQQNADIEATRRMHRLHHSGAYTLGPTVLNTLEPRDAVTNAPIRYTIVAHSSFRGQMDEFIQWKQRKGFLVDITYTDDPEMGSSLASIKAYLKSLYTNATESMPAPTYVLFVGDVAQIPAEQLNNSSTHHSDLLYFCWTDGDHIPDCYYGRFSANNVNELIPQISKTLMYEQFTMPDASYLSRAVLIAGVDRGQTGDNAYNYADPAMDYIAKHYVNSENGFSNVSYYKNNTTFAPTGVTVTGSSNASSTASTLRTLYNDGVGLVNYSAHGSESSWSEPSFTVSNANSMTNNDMPMLMIGNCCQSNTFNVDACLGEALLRKDNNAGAVGYIGASDYTYWVEDFYWAIGVRNNITNTSDFNYDASHKGLYDKLFHTHGEAYSDWYTSMGAMIMAGNMAVESSTSSLKEYYWQVYHLMGDPSVMPYIGQPSPITANVPTSIPAGSSEISISTVPYAYVALTNPDGQLVAATFANSNGDVILSIPSLLSPGEYEVAISAQNHTHFFQTVNVISNGPFLIVDNITLNGNVRAGSDINFDLTVRNIGVESIDSFSVEFITDEQHMLLDTPGQDTINQNAPFTPNQTINLTAKGAAHIWENVMNGTQSTVRVIIRWGTHRDELSSSRYIYTIDAPQMHYTSHTTTDNSSSVQLTLVNTNYGNDTVIHGDVELFPLDPGINVTPRHWTIDNVAPAQSISTTVTLDGSLPENCMVPFLQITNDGYKTTVDTIKVQFGIDLATITFEQNNWGQLDWVQGEYPWTIISNGAYQGNYCARSYQWTGYSGSNKTSEFSITWTSTADDSITFYKNVSSEANYDKFIFYIDNEQMENLSGTDNEWSRSSWFVPAGTHTFRFAYKKDYSQSRGSDCAWLDNIHLPQNGIIHTFKVDSVCVGESYIFGSDTIETAGMREGIYHYTDTTATSIDNLLLVVSHPVEVSITASGTLIRAGEWVRLSASQSTNLLWNTGATVPVIDVYPTETTTYTVTAYKGHCSSTASVTVNVNGSIGIDNAADRNMADIRLYPNPATNVITLSGTHIDRIVVCDMMGRTIERQTVDHDQCTLDISSLAPGVYIIQVFSEGSQPTVKKFIKKN